MKVFLGGTCTGTTWKEKLIKELDKLGVDYFNPIVEDWTPESIEEEHKQKDNLCDIHLYVITKEMIDVFSIAEAVDSAWRENKTCIFQIIPEGLNEDQIISLMATGDLISKQHGIVIWSNDFSELLHYLEREKVWEI